MNPTTQNVLFLRNDRVEHADGRRGYVASPSGSARGYVYVQFDNDARGAISVSKREVWLTEVNPASPSKEKSPFRQGDRIKATLGENVLVGKVLTITPSGSMYIEVDGLSAGAQHYLNSRDDWKFEKIYELPTKQYAMVRIGADVYVKQGVNTWRYMPIGSVSGTGHAESHLFERARDKGLDIETLFEGI